MASSMQSHVIEHRAWENWLSIVLGAVVLLVPIAMYSEATFPAIYNGAAVGVVVVAITLFEFIDRIRLQEAIKFVAGAWLMVSVFVIDYGMIVQLRLWHFVLGALIAVLAAFEFWQDSHSALEAK